jgi:hypothetical protein
MAGRRQRRGREQHFERRGVQELADFAKHWIRLVAIGLAATVVYLEAKNAPLDGIARIIDNTSLIKFGLFIFFIGWGWGATDDTRIQKRGYASDPELGRIGVKEWAGIILFIALFATLFFIPDRPVWFQLTLLGLIVVNSWTWRVIFDRTRSVIGATYEQCAAPGGARNTAALAKLLLVCEYMNGPWQRRRFLTLIMLAALQVPVAYLVASGAMAGYAAGVEINGVPGAVLVGYLPGTLFLLYVLISEIWMKVFRIRIFSDLETIDWIEAHFTLGKQRDCPLPQPHLAGALDFQPSSNANYEGKGPLHYFTSNA